MPFRLPLSPWLIRVLQIAVFAGLLVLLSWASDWRTAFDLLKGADPGWLLAAVGALTVQTILSAQRWRITAAQLGITIPPGAAVREYYLAQIVNQSLPGGMIGDAGRAVRARGEAGLLISGQAVVFERMVGQIGLLAVLVIGLTIAALVPIGFTWPIWLISPLLIFLTALALLPVAVFAGLKLLGPSDHVLRRFLRAFSHAALGRKVWVQQVGLSIGTTLCNLAAFAFCAAAVDVALPILVVVTVVPLILFAMLIPLSFGGWGFREGAATLLFPVIGATPSEGLAASVAFGLVLLVTVLPGVVLPLIRQTAKPPGAQKP